MRTYYKYIVIAVLLLAPATAAAQTIDLNAMLAKVAELKATLAALQAAGSAGNSGGGGGRCITIDRALSKGISGSDVTKLQEFLISEGMLAAGNNTGYFGNLTEAAVMKWQTAHGIEAVGNVGPKTRAAMAVCTGGAAVISNQCPVVTQPANCMSAVSVQLNGCTVGWQCTVTTLPTQTFTATPLSGPVPLVVRFAGVVTSANAGFCAGNFCASTLVFGDGETGAVPLPSAQNSAVTYAVNHVYRTPGNYIANLYQGTAGSGAPVVGNGIAINASASVVINPPVTPTGGMPYMTVSPTTGNAPISVTVTIMNATLPQSLSIEFGDGTFGSVQAAGSTYIANHTYAAAGSYTIKLRRTNYAGESCVSASCPVLASTGLSLGGGSVQSPSLAVTPATGGAPLPVTVFANAAGQYPGGVIVDFGDNSTEIICLANTVCTQRSTPHTYAAPGTYTVQLLASQQSGAVTLLKSTQVTVIAFQDTKLVAAPATGAVPLAVTFTGHGGNRTYAGGAKLDYGDGVVEEFCNTTEVCGEKKKTHTYTDGTVYTATLFSLDGSSASTTIGTAVVTGTGGPTKIKVTSPKGVARKGDTVTIAWTITGTIPSGSLSFDLYGTSGSAIGTLFSITNFENGSAQWKIPSAADTGCTATQPNGLCGTILTPGSYTIKPFLSGAVAQLSTEATFEVQNELNPPPPAVTADTASVSITVTPATAEIGKPMSVKYRVTNAPASSKVTLSLEKATGETVGTIETNQPATASDTTYSWVAGKAGSVTAEPGSYKIVANVTSPVSTNGQVAQTPSGSGTSAAFTLTKAGGTTPPVTGPRTAAVCTSLTNTLGLGDTDATKNGEVTKLQTFLASDATWYPEGVINGTFDEATQKAVQNYQKAKGIQSSGTPETTGYGQVGPATRASITTVSCNSNTAVTFTATPTSGRPALMVQFTISAGSGQAFSIDYGDGTTVAFAAGTTQASHTYANLNTYIAKLIINGTPAKTITITVSDTAGPQTNCAAITRQLNPDDTDATTGGDVTRLQQFLATNSSWYPEGTVNGIYGPRTEAAVKKYQQSKGIDQTGNIGPATLAAIKCGANAGAFIATPQTGNAPLTVKFTTDIDVSGGTYRVDFGDDTPSVWLTSKEVSHTYTTNKEFTASLIESLGNCIGKTDPDEITLCEAAYSKVLHTAKVTVGGSGASSITSKQTFYKFLYSCVLDRQGSDSEIAAWVGLNVTIHQSYLGFFNSPEYLAKNTANETFATQMYKCILQRDPESTAVPYWVERLTSGTTRADTLASFLITPEYIQHRVGPVVTATGMAAGTPATATTPPAVVATPVTGAVQCTNNNELPIMARVTMSGGTTKDFEFDQYHVGIPQTQYSDFATAPSTITGFNPGMAYFSSQFGGDRWVAATTRETGRTSGSISMAVYKSAQYVDFGDAMVCTVTWN